MKTKPKNADFPWKLLMARESRGWTQQTLADAAGLPVSCISHYERGRREPTLANLVKLAKALRISIDWMLGGDWK